MEQVLSLNKNMAFISMDEYHELLKMKEEIIKKEKIITFEIEKDIYHSKNIKFAYISKDDAIIEISNKNNNLNNEINNLRDIIKTNNDKYKNFDSEKRDLNTILNQYKNKNDDLSNEIKKLEDYGTKTINKNYELIGKINDNEKELTYLKNMSLFELLKWKFNKIKTK